MICVDTHTHTSLVISVADVSTAQEITPSADELYFCASNSSAESHSQLTFISARLWVHTCS